MTDRPIRIATRGSALALWQANHVRDTLLAARPGRAVELVIIKTRGDQVTDRPLAAIGGKALFVKEVEAALLDGRAELAVHSMKDVPGDVELAEGLHMAAVTERADPRDALCSAGGAGLDALPQNAHVGTSSLRRACQLRARRPDLRISNLRGNVPTRLSRLDDGTFDAVVLASAGLDRLGFADRIAERLDPAICIPAVGQGALGIETRADDREVSDWVHQALHHEADATRVAAERGFLMHLEGSCRTPLAAYAELDGDQVSVTGMVGKIDGTRILRGTRRGPAAEAEALGRALADELLAQGAQALIDASQVDAEAVHAGTTYQ
jgi:hydroxymethylbilane synthase